MKHVLCIDRTTIVNNLNNNFLLIYDVVIATLNTRGLNNPAKERYERILLRFSPMSDVTNKWFRAFYLRTLRTGGAKKHFELFD